MQPTTLAGSKLLILLGDGASPEVFTAPCGLTTRGLVLNSSNVDFPVPHPDDPDIPAWINRVAIGHSGNVSGSGVMAVESFDTWKDIFLSGDPVNVRIKLDHDDLGYYYGSFVLSALKHVGAFGDKVAVDVSLDSDGKIRWTDFEADIVIPSPGDYSPTYHILGF